MQQQLDEIIRNLILSKDAIIYITDVFKDEIVSYKFYDNKIVSDKKEQLTTYLENLENSVKMPYLKQVMELFSIPKFDEEKKNGNDKIKVKYQDLNGNWYYMSSTLVDNGTSKVIFTIKEDEKENTKSSLDITSKEKYNSLIANLSDAMLKIFNVFDVKVNNLDDIKKIEDYINTILNNLSNKYPELKKSFIKNAEDVSSMAYDSILIVDDDLVTRNMIKKVFSDEYKIIMATNGKEAIEYLESNNSKSKYDSSDNVLGIFLDLTMPVMDGFAVLKYLSENNYLSKIPVIIISGDYEKETKARVYNYNIADMLEKPFDFQIVKHRIKNFINLYKSSNSLNNLISTQNQKLKDLINPFVKAYEIDYSDNISKVQQYIEILATQVSIDYPSYNLSLDNIEKMKEASKYYDIGFYSIPRKILSKKKLDDNELDFVKNYPLFGFKMIEYLLSLTSDIKFKEYANNITKYYHENFDGTGYPNGLAKDKIPLEAQIASICIMHNNLSKKINDPKDIIVSKSGKNFAPKLIDSYIKVYDKFKNI